MPIRMILYIEEKKRRILAICQIGRQVARLEIRSPANLAIVVTIMAIWPTIAVAHQADFNRTLLTRGDLAAAETLTMHIAALSPSTRPEEAKRLAECAYVNASRLRREYGVIWPPLFNNVLINAGIKKRGFCFHWAEDLLVAFDALKLTTLELHWGEAEVGTWQESNCVVVTAKGQPFSSGIILDCWRHSGHLYWRDVTADKVRWIENRAYARFVRAKSAATDRPRFQKPPTPRRGYFRAAEN
jgi:hypothetical protein